MHYVFYLIDLNRMRFEEMTWAMRMKNFARLALAPDMIAIIGATYARLSGQAAEKTIDQIAQLSRRAAARGARKQTLKKRVGR